MKLTEIFLFELRYQLRRPQTWLFFMVLALLPGLMVRGNYLPDALYDDFFVNSPGLAVPGSSQAQDLTGRPQKK